MEGNSLVTPSARLEAVISNELSFVPWPHAEIEVWFSKQSAQTVIKVLTPCCNQKNKTQWLEIIKRQQARPCFLIHLVASKTAADGHSGGAKKCVRIQTGGSGIRVLSSLHGGRRFETHPRQIAWQETSKAPSRPLSLSRCPFRVFFFFKKRW